MMVFVKSDDVSCDAGAVGADGFSLQLETSYIAPTLSLAQNTIVASSSGVVLTQRNPGRFNTNIVMFLFRLCSVPACETAC